MEMPNYKSPHPNQYDPLRSHAAGTKAYIVCRVHTPGDEVLVADPKSWKNKHPRYRYFYIGTYSTNGYGHYRLLRNDGKEITCGTIMNIDMQWRKWEERTLEQTPIDWRPDREIPEDYYAR